MKKKDLKSGMIVWTANEHSYLVMKNTGLDASDLAEPNILVGIDAQRDIARNGWMGLSAYTEDLEAQDPDFTIVEVMETRYAALIGNLPKYQTIWRRGV